MATTDVPVDVIALDGKERTGSGTYFGHDVHGRTHDGVQVKHKRAVKVLGVELHLNPRLSCVRRVSATSGPEDVYQLRPIASPRA